MKNKEIKKIVKNISKIEDLKLGGLKLKVVLKNKKTLVKVDEELDELLQKLVKQYGTPMENEPTKVTFTPENNVLLNKEWSDVLDAESDIKLDKVFNVAELDQFSDLTLEQYEVLELMSE